MIIIVFDICCVCGSAVGNIIFGFKRSIRGIIKSFPMGSTLTCILISCSVNSRVFPSSSRKVGKVRRCANCVEVLTSSTSSRVCLVGVSMKH